MGIARNQIKSKRDLYCGYCLTRPQTHTQWAERVRAKSTCNIPTFEFNVRSYFVCIVYIVWCAYRKWKPKWKRPYFETLSSWSVFDLTNKCYRIKFDSAALDTFCPCCNSQNAHTQTHMHQLSNGQESDNDIRLFHNRFMSNLIKLALHLKRN